ncbi:MAG: 16S rRNA (guanine(527)-N(7))-methyltransferase RsmG [Alphaproteobacteria bacterium]|nr:16S rRNA (guanine(527)-N(7))-methyltransferase RsmG [Alphaproteobacteria bacterium]
MNNKVKFEQYESLLRQWSKRMNLVAPSTLNDVAGRHFADSAQLADVLPHGVDIIDLGSGAGFPGVVLAILGWNVTCVESIGKKVAFLTELKKQLDLPNLQIFHGRLENFIENIRYYEKQPVFTARAFASLIKILDYVGKTKYRLFLLKGREVMAEINEAKHKYKFKYELIPSKTGDGFITIISDIK